MTAVAESASAAKDKRLEVLLPRVIAHLRDSGDFAEQTVDRVAETLTRFTRRLRALGITTVTEVGQAECRQFVLAPTSGGRPPEVHTLHARRTALRMLFRSLRRIGVDVGDPTLDLVLPARTSRVVRPLTDAEVEMCRYAARLGEAGAISLRRAVAWALGEATAVTSEISAVRVLDLDDPDEPRWVRLPGTRRHDARAGELTSWGSLIVARQVFALCEQGSSPEVPLVYRGAAVPGDATAQAAASNQVAAVLAFAGLRSEPDVRPASLRNWAGRRLYDAGQPIEEVARRMGSRSLDAAAEDIALNWRPT
jgi:integrase/recombinase XerC